DTARAISRSVRTQHSVIFLIGNKKEMCAAATLAAWLRDQDKLSDPKDSFLFVFTGSALDNAFVCGEMPGTDKVSYIEKLYGISSADLPHHRLTIQQLIYLIKLRQDEMTKSTTGGIFPALLFESPPS